MDEDVESLKNKIVTGYERNLLLNPRNSGLPTWTIGPNLFTGIYITEEGPNIFVVRIINDGLYHSLVGPARIEMNQTHDKNLVPIQLEYWYQGRKIDFDKFNQLYTMFYLDDFKVEAWKKEWLPEFKKHLTS